MVADPHHIDADPNSSFHFDADPDPAPHQSNAILKICDHWYTDPERRNFEPPVPEF
jgi:hypothetical protein